MLGNKTEGLAHVIHNNITSQYTNEEFTKKIPVCWIIKVASKSILVCASKFSTFNGRPKRWNVQLNQKSKRGIIPVSFLLSIIRNWLHASVVLWSTCFCQFVDYDFFGVSKTPDSEVSLSVGFSPKQGLKQKTKMDPVQSGALIWFGWQPFS